MSEPARTMSKDSAFEELTTLQNDKVILLEGAASPEQVSLDGWDPDGLVPENGNVGGVVVRYWASGTKSSGAASGGAAPDRLDPRNALALVRLCRWLAESYGVSELYHLGISGGGVDVNGNPRTDCHGQGRAVDFVGVKIETMEGEQVLTVFDDWGTVSTAATPGGDWPAGAGSDVHYRLDEADTDAFAGAFFRDLYQFIASEWQDRTDGPDGVDGGSTIGERSFVMHPDHPATAPGTPHGREAHKSHLHMQIGVTGTES